MIWNILSYLILNIFWVYIIYRFYNFYFRRQYKNIAALIGSYVFFYILNSSLQLIFHHPFLNMATSLIGLCIIVWNYQSDTFRKLLAVALFYSLSMICDITVTAAFRSYYIGMRPEPALIVLSYFLLFVIEVIIERVFFLKNVQKIAFPHWIALMAAPAGSIAVICMIIIAGYPDRRINLSISLILFFINIMIYALYDSIQNTYLEKLRNSYMEKLLAAYAQQQDIQVHSQERIDAIHHDLKHYLLTIHALAGQNQCEEIQTYVESLQGTLNEAKRITYCANSTIDSILNYMLQNVRQQFSSLDIDVQLPEQIDADLIDINIVLGNLMDNAIHAALESNEKALALSVKLQTGTLKIRIENSYSGILLEKDDSFLTTKPHTDSHRHGIGLMNVKNIVEKYNGIIRFSHDDRRFTVYVMLYI